MRGALTILLLCVVQFVSAQIRIIPQDVVRKATDIEVAESPLRFATDEINFGTIDEMSGVWQGSAVLTNGGEEPISITQIKSTCGCFKAEMPKRLLAPRESINVLLKYYPRGHAGRVFQRVMLYANGSNDYPSAILKLRGVVTASADRGDDYPYTRGVLRLRQDTVRLSGGQEVQRIAIMNGGSTELMLEVDANLLPKGLKVQFEPSRVAPKGQGYMVVEYTPTTEIMPANLGKIYIKGLNLPPRQSAIEVILKN